MDEKQTGLVHNPVCGQIHINDVNKRENKDTK